MEYEGHWGWDLALFLKQAEINAYQNGQRVGEVEFKVPYTASEQVQYATKRIGFMMDTVFGKKTAEEATKAAEFIKFKKRRTSLIGLLVHPFIHFHFLFFFKLCSKRRRDEETKERRDENVKPWLYRYGFTSLILIKDLV